jgi:hypothetical protein
MLPAAGATQAALRQARQPLSLIEMAKFAAMEQSTYSRKESRKSTITEEEWQRFTKAL